MKSIAKIALLGDTSVGKTCLVTRFAHNEFNSYSFPTIGAAFSTLKIPVNEKTIELHVFDCAGSDRFNSLLPIYLRGVSYCILLYSVDDIGSQKNILNRWADYIKEHNITHLYVVGNKIDLPENEFHLEFLGKFHETFDSINVKYFLTSAKTGSGIHNLFTQIAEDVYCKSADFLPDNIIYDSDNVVLTKEKWRIISKCCY